MKLNEIDSLNSQNIKPPLAASFVLGKIPILKEPHLLGDWVFWLEQRPNEGGRTTALIRPWGRPDLFAQELTPAPINLRSRVHDYGGGAVSVEISGEDIYLTWLDDSDGCLWFQPFEVLKKPIIASELWLKPKLSPMRLSLKGGGVLADGSIDLLRNRWIGVLEENGKDFLVSFALDKADQHPKILHFPKDFLGYAVISPDAQQLVWVEWQQPDMPWDSSQLWWARFDNSGDLGEKILLAGSGFNQSTGISVFQPLWLETGELVVAEDSSGWWNLMLIGPEIKPDIGLNWRRLWPMKAEVAMPQWIYGMSTSSSAGDKIISAICEQAKWQLKLLSKDGVVDDLHQPFDDLSGIDAQSGRAVVIASNALKVSGLLEVDLNTSSWHHTPVIDFGFDVKEISVAESFWFKGFKGQSTHAWYYPPRFSPKGAGPLLVKSHSGPTGMASRGLNLSIQFWTSRGWGVVDVNYGGSTGFGRAYRERLKGGWGEVDVFDCAAAAEALIAAGKADKERIAIEGGSAGGFTTLACLCFTNVFNVGACRYAVSDLIAMAKETHRFEAGYLDHLLGTFSDSQKCYYDRSPINHAEKINCPVIFFQGLQDKVVVPEQTKSMVSVLRKKKIPVELFTFSEEGHGFRDGAVRIKVLEETEKFFRKHLSI